MDGAARLNLAGAARGERGRARGRATGERAAGAGTGAAEAMSWRLSGERPTALGQSWPSRAESQSSDSRLGDSAKMSDSRLGESATRAPGRDPSRGVYRRVTCSHISPVHLHHPKQAF